MNKTPFPPHSSRLPLADKSLGQHFLKDQSVIKSICHDFFGPFENSTPEAFIEIGPGPGILTSHLKSRSKELGIPFFAIEKDERFKNYLSEFIDINSELIFTDALQFDFNKFLKEKNLQGKNIWLVSNLPYNISAPLFIKFIGITEFKFMTLMFQQEVAKKIHPSLPAKNAMNSLWVLANNFYETSLLCKVPPGAFLPPPKVDSMVLSFQRKSSPAIPLCDFSQLESFLRKLFSGRRKQLGGVLKHFYPTQKINDVFGQLNIKTSIRSEALSLEEVVQLYFMFQKIPIISNEMIEDNPL